MARVRQYPGLSPAEVNHALAVAERLKHEPVFSEKHPMTRRIEEARRSGVPEPVSRH